MTQVHMNVNIPPHSTPPHPPPHAWRSINFMTQVHMNVNIPPHPTTPCVCVTAGAVPEAGTSLYIHIHVCVHLCVVSLESRLFHRHMWHVCLKLAPSIGNLPLTYRIWELIWCNPKLLFVCHRLSWFIPYESDHKWSVWHNHVEISRVMPQWFAISNHAG